jgi:hypothetical protein
MGKWKNKEYRMILLMLRKNIRNWGRIIKNRKIID